MRRTVQLPPIFGAVELRAETAKPAARTVEATFHSGAPVLRVPLFADPFELEFAMTPTAAKLGRLNAGAPVLDSHRDYAGVSAILGVVERAWLEGGEGRAVLRLSERAEVEPIFRD